MVVRGWRVQGAGPTSDGWPSAPRGTAEQPRTNDRRFGTPVARVLESPMGLVGKPMGLAEEKVPTTIHCQEKPDSLGLPTELVGENGGRSVCQRLSGLPSITFLASPPPMASNEVETTFYFVLICAVSHYAPSSVSVLLAIAFQSSCPRCKGGKQLSFSCS